MTIPPPSLSPQGGDAPAQLALVLHHIGVVVRDIALARDEYSRMFHYEPVSDVFHDHVQTAYVQFLKLPGDSIFLEIVSPDGPDSKVAQTLRKGGGLHHVCYATSDIDRSWSALRAEGLFPLQRPVPAVAFGGRRIAWFLGRDRMPFELVERNAEDGL